MVGKRFATRQHPSITAFVACTALLALISPAPVRAATPSASHQRCWAAVNSPGSPEQDICYPPAQLSQAGKRVPLMVDPSRTVTRLTHLPLTDIDLTTWKSRFALISLMYGDLACSRPCAGELPAHPRFLVVIEAEGTRYSSRANGFTLTRDPYERGDWLANGYLPARHLSFRVAGVARVQVIQRIAQVIVALSEKREASVGARQAQYDTVMVRGVPPAAASLARRLGLHSRAYVGDQPNGAGRPWTVWLHKLITPGSVGPGNVERRYLYSSGPALFSGPRAARGEFHYFDLTPVSTDQAVDPYRGPPLTKALAVRNALQWLHRAGVPIPPGPMHAIVRGGSTDIGGTGLCCFRYLAPVWWGQPSPAEEGLRPAKYEVYVADAGAVVQVDMGAPAGAESLANPCPGDHRDGNGIALGPWCFSYPGAAGGIMHTEVGYGHDGLILDPDQIALDPFGSILMHAKHVAPLRRISLAATRAVYRLTANGTTYQVTLLPAFLDLVGSTWEVTYVRTVRTTKAARPRDSR